VIKLPGKPLQSDEVDLGADGAWGVMIGPGGVLALQAYCAEEFSRSRQVADFGWRRRLRLDQAAPALSTAPWPKN
jgi:hypothetical protein